MPERNRGYLRKQRLRNIERRKKLISQRELMYHGYKTLNDPDFKEGMLHKGHSGRLGMGGTAVKTNTRAMMPFMMMNGGIGDVFDGMFDFSMDDTDTEDSEDDLEEDE